MKVLTGNLNLLLFSGYQSDHMDEIAVILNMTLEPFIYR